MAKITYHDLEKAAPTVTWFGVEFKDGEAVDLDAQKQLTAEQKDEMLMRAATSGHYKVEGKTEGKDGKPLVQSERVPPLAPGSPQPGEEGQYEAGHKAALGGAKRDAYKNAAWLKGFDAAIEELEEAAKHEKAKDPRRNK
jgi:hypothetical protein